MLTKDKYVIVELNKGLEVSDGLRLRFSNKIQTNKQLEVISTVQGKTINHIEVINNTQNNIQSISIQLTKDEQLNIV